MVATPLGPLVLVHDVDGLLWASVFATSPQAVETVLARFAESPLVEADVPPPCGLAAAFAAYFAGDANSLEEVTTGRLGTPAERAVWAAIRSIPPGTTRTCAEVAALLGDVTRACEVAEAARRNPLALVVPCHRVAGAFGWATGDAAARRAWLLAHEASRRPGA